MKLNFRLHKILGRAIRLWLCLLAVPAALSGCQIDDEGPCADCAQGAAQLQMRLTTQQEASVRQTEKTEAGRDHEFISTLTVFIVDAEGFVAHKIQPELTGNALAREGNLRIYLSEPFTLAAGSYTVYAFANIDTEYLPEWNKISSLVEGKPFPAAEVATWVLKDPATMLRKENFTTGRFIPMSARQDITVTSATRSLSIGLDRLVSKVRISIDPQTVGAKSVTLSGCADGVSLLPGSTAPAGVAYDDSVTHKFAEAENGVLPDFYVNATEQAGHAYTVRLTTNEHSGTTYEAVTSRSELPRNSIFPLTLQLNQYGLKLEAQCWVSSIGHVPVPVKVSLDPDTYEVEVPEGCQFAFTVNVVQTSDGAVVAAPSSKWTIQSSTIPGIAFDGATDGVQTVRGHISATVGQTYDLGAEVSWTAGGKTYRRFYTVHLTVGDITGFEFASGSRLLRPEFLSLMQIYK
jgi:hypothetical protein